MTIGKTHSLRLIEGRVQFINILIGFPGKETVVDAIARL
jgi:hypothetical protein